MPEIARAGTAMPDPMAKWTPVPDWSTAALSRTDWTARPVQGLSIILLAGNMQTALAAHAGGSDGLGFLATAERPEDYTMRIARDRALRVATAPIALNEGWQPGGFSATSADGAYGVIEMAGDAIEDIIAEATATDPATGSRSAATLFAGIACLVVRIAPGTVRLHLEIGHMPYLWRWLDRRP